MVMKIPSIGPLKKTIWANGPYTLAGSPAWRLVLNPLVAYTSTTVYTYLKRDSNLGLIEL